MQRLLVKSYGAIKHPGVKVRVGCCGTVLDVWNFSDGSSTHTSALVNEGKEYFIFNNHYRRNRP